MYHLPLYTLYHILFSCVCVCLCFLCRYGDVLTDTDGLPLVYDSDSIGRYWDKRPGEVSGGLQQFLDVCVVICYSVSLQVVSSCGRTVVLLYCWIPVSIRFVEIWYLEDKVGGGGGVASTNKNPDFYKIVSTDHIPSIVQTLGTRDHLLAYPGMLLGLF